MIVYAAVNALIPASFKVERHAELPISEKKLYNYLRNSTHFKSWNPWVKEGEGSWEYFGEQGKLKSGLRISELDEKESVELELAYVKPTQDVRFKFLSKSCRSLESIYFFIERQENGETKLTVGLKGKSSFPFRIFNLMEDKLVSPDLEKALNQIWLNNREEYSEQ